jgi:hypothetical protein
MHTAVIQTYRTEHQPPWIAKCLDSAEAWAEANAWEYLFRGDDIFDLVPSALQKKYAEQLPLQIDIARLIWARDLLRDKKTLERVVWLDADVFVFDPDSVCLDDTTNFAVGRQIWVQPTKGGALKTYKQVHNAILTFQKSTPVLDFLLQTVLDLAERHNGPATPQLLGPKLLTALHNVVGFSVIDSVGMASPLVLADLAAGKGPALTRLKSASQQSIGAVNLCTSYRGQTIDGVVCDDALFEAAIKRLAANGLT